MIKITSSTHQDFSRSHHRSPWQSNSANQPLNRVQRRWCPSPLRFHFSTFIFFYLLPTAGDWRWRPRADLVFLISAIGIWSPTMEAERMRQLMLLWLRRLSTRVALVGGNHTAARFCSR
ncbi:hypothetical protein C4D60_Mb10t01380 [Musa balbisiana]|uniref:Uncharacterized protein n=1 Tax=Musa balbisiana TaxID=52838 RepID=A0A4S8ITV7_MUSBA|nr:hypothetical protein C4D60_Mb10t01380 [Musa balbisiana]